MLQFITVSDVTKHFVLNFTFQHVKNLQVVDLCPLLSVTLQKAKPYQVKNLTTEMLNST